ncbi:MAG: ATP-binding protein [Planctomycetota bacterium]
MPRKRLLWQLYPSYLLLTVIAVLAVAWYTSHSLRRFYFRQVSEDIKSRAHLVRPQIVADLTDGNYEKIDRYCKTTGPLSGTRITVILPGGRVIGDSDEQIADMKNHADRPEFRQALTGRIGSSTRFSDTLGKNMMYLAIPIQSRDSDGAVLAVVRTSVPVSAIDEALRQIYLKILWAVLIVAILAAVISLALSKRISRPIETIKEAANRFASGDLALRLTVSKPEELADLAKAMNKMAYQLDQRIRTITTQSAESDAILSSMIEGVIAVDSDGRIVRINRAAADFFNVNTKQAKRCPVEEAVDNADVVEFVQQALGSVSPIETEVIVTDDEKRHLKLHAARLADANGSHTGAVIVLTDMTRIRQLQKVRRDFVANVSHELKTPITSIKGFVETLQEGALTEPEEAARFLTIIARHADRLNAIIDDLLSLSRLEEDSERRALSFEMTPLKAVLTEAIDLSTAKAKEKQIRIDLDCKETIAAGINPALLEQAVTNLINNAIKYSDESSRIEISAEQNDDQIHIAVRDEGCGIDKKYHERIFQRFYVVDKSRSRKLGGTGLGLAIVKHIAQVHNGRVTVESQPGRGSTFRIHLPANE